MTTDQRSGVRPAGVVLARAANALFFLITATYCILTYSSFAFQQFIRPHLIAALGTFVVWHHLWHWLMLGLTALTLWPGLKSGRGRVLAWGYLAAMAAVGVVVLIQPILPSVENDGLGLRLAFLFLVPPIWLGLYDHVAAAARFHPMPSTGQRVLASTMVAALIVWAIHLAAVPLRLGGLGDLRLGWGGAAFGAATSLAVHLLVFLALGVVTVGALAAARKAGYGGRGEYCLIASVSAVGTLLIVARLVFAALSFKGLAAWFLAAELALALTAVWSGSAVRLAEEHTVSALEAWFLPLPGATSRRAAVAALLALPFVGFMVLERVSRFDWDFLVQHLCVIGIWVMACAYTYTVLHVGRPAAAIRSSSMAFAAGALLMFAGVRGGAEFSLSHAPRSTFVPEFALDGYAAADPSYRLIRHLLWVDPPGSTEFYADLQANSLIQHVSVSPIDVDFVAPLKKAASPVPNIFLFVVDSLRRDYVSAYNPAVHFTPALGRFASENDAFNRAFTRYGGTGLSMPAMWAGGMLLHKEYVLPFQPMNALDKLLKANGYRYLIGMDHITTQLIDPIPSVDELDRGRSEMNYDFCATLSEIEARIAGHVPGEPPIFVHTRSLNLHVSKLTAESRALAKTYEGFQGPAAAAVARMDRCFGDFVDALKASGQYDNSIVILTSDHGDSLGEGQRWGHSYTLFPEVVRTPLLIHVPARLRTALVVDTDAVSFSTDLTPTLYVLLGYSPVALGWMYGSPLYAPPDHDQAWRRHTTFLLASSYGPVYGLLAGNGRSLYIADGVNARDYAYDLSELHPVRVGVTDAMRQESRIAIRDRLTQVADAYHFTPRR